MWIRLPVGPSQTKPGWLGVRGPGQWAWSRASRRPGAAAEAAAAGQAQFTSRLYLRPVSEIADFGLVILVVGGFLTLAVFSNKLSERFPIPAPAIFLLVAALAGSL